LSLEIWCGNAHTQNRKQSPQVDNPSEAVCRAVATITTGRAGCHLSVYKVGVGCAGSISCGCDRH
jgi:hypothetical protein